ncbi:MAG: hypothetical protein ACFFD4_07410 [Candidatus Odinarchaeota archaeon]
MKTKKQVKKRKECYSSRNKLMIHLVAIVFQGGVGISLYDDESTVKEPNLIWSLISAMSMFSAEAIDAGEGGFSEIKVGKYRIVVYDPFKEDAIKKSIRYTFTALQDAYDNYFITTEKLREIHEVLLPYGLDAEDPFITFQKRMNADRAKVDNKIETITRRTQFFPKSAFERVNNLMERFVDEQQIYRPLVVMLNDVDGGLITYKLASDFYEDMSFTELILSNIISENPNDAKSVWIEREAPDWILTQSTGLSEAFVMQHVGKKSDFRILARIVFSPGLREQVRKELNEFQEAIYKVISERMED